MAESDRDVMRSLAAIRRRRRFYWVVLGLILVGFVLAFRVPPPWKVAAPIIYVFVAGASVAYAGLLMRQIECPRCHQLFFRRAGRVFGLATEGWAYGARRCASCGLPL
jgi:hypothetical protein